LFNILRVLDPASLEKDWYQSSVIEDLIRLCWGTNASKTSKINEGQLYCAIGGYQICSGGLTSYTQNCRRFITSTLLEKVSVAKPTLADDEEADGKYDAGTTGDIDGVTTKNKKNRKEVLSSVSKSDFAAIAAVLRKFAQSIEEEDDDSLFDPRDTSNHNEVLDDLIDKYWTRNTSLDIRRKAYDFAISLLFPRKSFGEDTWKSYMEQLASKLPEKSLRSSDGYNNCFNDSEQLLSDLMVYAFVSHVFGFNYRVWNIFSTIRENIHMVNSMCEDMEVLLRNDQEKAEAFGTDVVFSKKLSNFLVYGEAFSDKDDGDNEGDSDAEGVTAGTRGKNCKRWIKRSARTEVLLNRARKRVRVEDSAAAPAVDVSAAAPAVDVSAAASSNGALGSNAAVEGAAAAK
jgi:hypothetical protein